MLQPTSPTNPKERRESSLPLRNILKQRTRRKFPQIVRRKRRIPRQNKSITVHFARDPRVDRGDPELAELLAHQPPHLPGDISNIDVGAGVQGIGEHGDLVALVDEFIAFRLAHVRGQHARGTVAERDVVALVRVCPAEDVADEFGERDIVQGAVTAGNEDADVLRVLGEAFAPDFGEIERLTEFGLVFW